MSQEVTVRVAASAAEREAVYRLRYEVYVEELRMFGGVADHAARRLTDPHDERSRLLLATVDGEPVGTLRLTWGGDGAFSEEFVETYALDRFAAVVPPERVLVGTRFMVPVDHRGGMVPFRLIEAATRFGVEHQVEVALVDCQPHLIRMYLRLGFRSYCPTYNDPQMALMVPLALVVRDLAHLDRVRSPLRACGLAGLEKSDATDAVIAQLPEWAPVRSIDLHGAYDWAREVEGGEDDRRRVLRLFNGLDSDELAAALAHSHVIDVDSGQVLIRRGQLTRTMYLALAGSLEVWDGGHVVRMLGPGSSVGEIAFLLRRPRTLDVVAGPDGARLLSLHEPALRDLVEARSHAAAVLLLNLASGLAEQLAGAR
jgi:predicted GNAT family N-acyltransferase